MRGSRNSWRRSGPRLRLVYPEVEALLSRLRGLHAAAVGGRISPFKAAEIASKASRDERLVRALLGSLVEGVPLTEVISEIDPLMADLLSGRYRESVRAFGIRLSGDLRRKARELDLAISMRTTLSFGLLLLLMISATVGALPPSLLPQVTSIAAPLLVILGVGLGGRGKGARRAGR